MRDGSASQPATSRALDEADAARLLPARGRAPRIGPRSAAAGGRAVAAAGAVIELQAGEEPALGAVLQGIDGVGHAEVDRASARR